MWQQYSSWEGRANVILKKRVRYFFPVDSELNKKILVTFVCNRHKRCPGVSGSGGKGAQDVSQGWGLLVGV